MENQPITKGPSTRIDEERAEELAARIRALDQKAFREFVLGFAPAFAIYFAKNGLPDTDAQMQALLCAEKTALMIRAGKYEFRRVGGVIAWSFSIAQMEIKNWHRRNRPTSSLEEHKGGLSGKKTGWPASPEGSIVSAEIVQVVREAIAKLSPTDQEIINLRLMNITLSYDEIAIKLGINNGTARTRYSRANDRLRQLLENDPRIKPTLQHQPHKHAQEVNK